MRLIIHCSASKFGCASIIRKWHTDKPPKGRGWRDGGYHAVIGNGYPDASYLTAGPNGKPIRAKIYNGQIELLRMLDADADVDADEQGAHAYGFNKNSVAMCLIGNDEFTKQQIISAIKLVKFWQFQFDIKLSDIYGHCELPGASTSCPNIDMDLFRALVMNKSEGIRTFRRMHNVKEVWES